MVLRDRILEKAMTKTPKALAKQLGLLPVGAQALIEQGILGMWSLETTLRLADRLDIFWCLEFSPEGPEVSSS